MLEHRVVRKNMPYSGLAHEETRHSRLRRYFSRIVCIIPVHTHGCPIRNQIHAVYNFEDPCGHFFIPVAAVDTAKHRARVSDDFLCMHCFDRHL